MKCTQCNKEIFHEKSPEAEYCAYCERPFCDECVDWTYMSKINTIDIICKECSKLIEESHPIIYCSACGNEECIGCGALGCSPIRTNSWPESACLPPQTPTKKAL